MYSRCLFSKFRSSVIILVILLALLFLSASRKTFSQKLRKHLRRPLREKNSETDDKKSGLVSFPDNGLTEKGSLPLRENRRQGSTDNSSTFIFINSYMRSGSTFLGQVLGLRSDAFYYYEPLHDVWKSMYTKGSELCDLIKPSCEYKYGALRAALNFLSDVFNCRLRNHFGKINQKLIRMLSGTKWNSFNTCVAQHRNVKECLVTTEEECMSTKHRVVKVLRMSLADAALMLSKHPNLVIVHLFRDPRGTFNSHIRTNWFPVERENIDTLINDTKTICGKIKDDLVTGKILMTKFPDRVKLVHYEDIYGNKENVKILYKWLGMDLLDDSEEFLSTQIHKKYDKMEKSSYLSGPFKYRRQLSFKHIQIIDNECKEVIRMLGFKLYKTEADLHDIEFNPIDGKLPFEP